MGRSAMLFLGAVEDGAVLRGHVANHDGVGNGRDDVAVSSGLEALAAFGRRMATKLGRDEVVVKIDFCNAFNSVFRSAIAAAVLQHVPELARYVEAAYGAPTLLFCNGGTVSSEMGVQQGDPLGPVLFSLAALACTTLPPELRAPLRGSGWYLDDGLLMGPAAVRAALQHVEAEGAKIGLEPNTRKLRYAKQSRQSPRCQRGTVHPFAHLEGEMPDLQLGRTCEYCSLNHSTLPLNMWSITFVTF